MSAKFAPSPEQMRARLSLSLLLGLAACSAPAPGGRFDDGKNDPNVGSFGTPKDPGLGTGTPGVGADGCAEAARLVYVVSDADTLYAFRPSEARFDPVGKLACPAGAATPNSMAVDRSGTAWVNYSDGSLFKVSTKDARCEATSYKAGQGGFVKFGMAFATNGSGSRDETLYVVGIDTGDRGKGLAKIDLSTMTLSTIGDFSGVLTGRGAELTGTGDGRLFGFFTTKPSATLAAIDAARGATSEDRTLSGVSTGVAWAFSFWGGDFWFYTSDGSSTSSVTRLKTSSDRSIGVVKQDVGFTIVGAGVSTCAPTEPPR
ncbi:MAG: hypothetical protein KC657_28425 [Myxococcales bacterium]|nr:hypothetical protein [Myxococcales bacterium]